MASFSQYELFFPATWSSKNRKKPIYLVLNRILNMQKYIKQALTLLYL